MLDQVYRVIDTMQRDFDISRRDAIEIANQIMIICTSDNSINDITKFGLRAQPRVNK